MTNLGLSDEIIEGHLQLVVLAYIVMHIPLQQTPDWFTLQTELGKQPSDRRDP